MDQQQAIWGFDFHVSPRLYTTAAAERLVQRAGTTALAASTIPGVPAPLEPVVRGRATHGQPRRPGTGPPRATSFLLPALALSRMRFGAAPWNRTGPARGTRAPSEVPEPPNARFSGPARRTGRIKHIRYAGSAGTDSWATRFGAADWSDIDRLRAIATATNTRTAPVRLAGPAARQRACRARHYLRNREP